VREERIGRFHDDAFACTGARNEKMRNPKNDWQNPAQKKMDTDLVPRFAIVFHN
jgi:hypothetical protein